MTEKLNVCLINDSFPPVIDGVANAVTNYAGIIQRSHGSAAVVTPYYPEADDSAFDFPVYRYPSLDMTKLVGYRAGVPFSAELMQKLESAKFDLIHTHCPVASTVLARLLRDRLRVPTVFTYHTKFDIDIANATHSELLQEAAVKLLVQNISACDEVWTVSKGAGDNLRSLGYEGESIVMPNGVDFPKGRVSADKLDEACGAVELPEGLPVFLFVGRMMWYKGVRISLDALAALKGEGRDFRMLFIGKGQDLDEIKEYCASLGLGDKVIFVPPVYDRDILRAWYCRADLFLFPSTFDTNGLVVREAAACALPSVMIRGSCAAEDITDGENGFLIDENAESMAALLRVVMDKKELMRAVGERAQSEIYISWDDAVSNACDRYEAVIEKFRAGAFPEHDTPTDELLKATADVMAARNHVRQQQRARRQTVTDSFHALYEELRTESLNAQEKLEELWQQFDRFL